MLNKKIFIGCHAIIKKDNKILLGKRNKKASKNNGKYFTIGGTLEFLEKSKDCLKREVSEESNIKIKNINFFKIYEFVNSPERSDKHRLIFLFTAEYKSGKLKGDDDCIDPEFFTKEEIKKLIVENKVHPFVIKSLKDLGEIV